MAVKRMLLASNRPVIVKGFEEVVVSYIARNTIEEKNPQILLHQKIQLLAAFLAETPSNLNKPSMCEQVILFGKFYTLTVLSNPSRNI